MHTAALPMRCLMASLSTEQTPCGLYSSVSEEQRFRNKLGESKAFCYSAKGGWLACCNIVLGMLFDVSCCRIRACLASVEVVGSVLTNAGNKPHGGRMWHVGAAESVGAKEEAKESEDE